MEEKGKVMTDEATVRRFTRRDFLKFGGQGALVLLAGGAIGGGFAGRFPGPANAQIQDVRVRLAATDGYIETPDGETHYIFGFTNKVVVPPSVPNRRVMGYIARHYKGRARMTAPNLVASEGQHLYVTLTNLGLNVRPDLDDSHTVHYHGFPNAIPLFDGGAPDQTFAVPAHRNFTYFYNLREPGTYPYHCHFEDVEHIQMGMVGTIIIRPAQGPDYAYNDASTRFDREYVMFITEMDPRIHRRLETVQESQTDWSAYNPSYWLLNGRAYPDTLKDNDDPSLPHQPVSSLIKANSGESVLLRFNSLGYQEHAIEAPGLSFRVVGQDAKLLRGTDGTDLTYYKDVVNVQPGTTFDVIFDAPDVSQLTKYELYSRDLQHASNAGSNSPGGIRTEVWVYPAGTLGPQSGPNQ